MRIRILVVLLLLALVVAPGAGLAGDLSRTPVPRAPEKAWSLTQLLTGIASRITKLLQPATETSVSPGAPKGGVVTIDEGGCVDPMGGPRCGS